MNKDMRRSVLEYLLRTDVHKCSVNLCLAAGAGEDETPEMQRVTLGRNITGEFASGIDKFVRRLLSEYEKGHLVLHKYDPSTKLDEHEIEFVDLREHETIGAQFASLAKLSSLDQFSEDESFIAALRFYVLVLQPSKGEPILIFRSYSPKKELGRSSMVGLTLQRGHYDKVRQRVFLFDHGVDCVAHGNILLIFNKSNFQKIFQFYEMMIKTAAHTLGIIEKKIPIDDFPAFRDACMAHLLKLAKLKNISSKPYLQKITMADIKKVIQRYNLPIQTVRDKDGEKVHYDASDKWAILRLLDDDYLESVLTEQHYEVNSKRLM